MLLESGQSMTDGTLAQKFPSLTCRGEPQKQINERAFEGLRADVHAPLDSTATAVAELSPGLPVLRLALASAGHNRGR
jgi:hypothetical protein